MSSTDRWSGRVPWSWRCVAVLPLVGGAVGGGLIAGGGLLGLVVGIVVLLAVGAIVLRRRKHRAGFRAGRVVSRIGWPRVPTTPDDIAHDIRVLEREGR